MTERVATAPLLAAVLDTAREGVWLLDADGVTEMSNRRMAAMLGVEPTALVGRPALDFLERVPTAADGEELALRRADGTEVWALVVASAVEREPGSPAGLLLMASDLTDRKSAEAALVHQAFHDGLTGLPNRALFLDRLRHSLSRSARRGNDTAVLFLDVDRFKLVNDSLGHAIGDEVLRAVSDRLCSVLRAGDTVARFGGDEFVILCEDIGDGTEAVVLAERVAKELARPLAVADREIALSASIGIALSHGAEDSAEVLVRDADAAMYQAKDRGRDRIEVFGDDMRLEAVTRLETKTDLRRAVERGELVVYYQPVMALASARVAGVEALVRWPHPERGMVPPSDFIALAEDSGLILPIGALVLTEACRDVAGWNRRHPKRPPLTLAVNLSARQLASPGLAEMVRVALDESGLDAPLLCLEITESVLMHDTAGNRAVLGELKDLGLTLAVDDFGTGWSSLLYLRQFPVDLLKIDRSFVAGIGSSPADEAIVAGVVGLAKGLGLTAVAEGVETAEQYFALSEMGCDMAQGFHWSPALPAAEIEAWLDAAWTDDLAPVPAARHRNARVLVADDQAAVRDMVRLVLEMEGGFEVVGQAANGWEAVELARRHQPDLVVLDLVMPGMGGPQALPHVRNAAPAARVVVLTATDLGAIDPEVLAGVDGVFDKTLDMSAMAGHLAAAFSNP
ncbi:MAG TPA: EAL domain-containing protein [Acidimicrobiales bacterium]|nr:EAL domain-containing protein [Acidimicrobiales bacterium]